LHQVRRATTVTVQEPPHTVQWPTASFSDLVESRIGQKRGFGSTPDELVTLSKPNPYPKYVSPPARKGFTKPNL